jgi:imidazole glycerol-phosphate synthase subunit HisH
VIALVDYGAGNLTSVRKALAAVGADVKTPQQPSDLIDVEGVIVPGVGNFARTAALDRTWREAIVGVVERGRPLLGICVGLQWLFEGSTEAPGCPGLSMMAGECQLLKAEWPNKVPHVGWNELEFSRASRLFDGIPERSQVYFTHSYAAPVTDDTVAVTTHVVPFASAVERGHVFGVQFHPEKSGDVGLHVLKNFLNAL